MLIPASILRIISCYVSAMLAAGSCLRRLIKVKKKKEAFHVSFFNVKMILKCCSRASAWKTPSRLIGILHANVN